MTDREFEEILGRHEMGRGMRILLLSVVGVSMFFFANSHIWEPGIWVVPVVMIAGGLIALSAYGFIKLLADYKKAKKRVEDDVTMTERQRQIVIEMKNEIVKTYYEALKDE